MSIEIRGMNGKESYVRDGLLGMKVLPLDCFHLKIDDDSQHMPATYTLSSEAYDTHTVLFPTVLSVNPYLLVKTI